MEPATLDLSSLDHLDAWDLIRGDTHSRSTVDALLKLEAASKPVFNRLLCYVHDVAVYKLGAVYVDLPPNEDPEHYFVSTAEGSFEEAPIASTPTEDEAYALAVTQLRLMETYLRAHVAATAA